MQYDISVHCQLQNPIDTNKVVIVHNLFCQKGNMLFYAYSYACYSKDTIICYKLITWGFIKTKSIAVEQPKACHVYIL